MKLRLNVPLQDLAYIPACCFSVNNFQNIFPLDCCDGHKAISLCVLARQRPTVENNAQVLPVCIQKTVVINCFEVFIEKPSNLPARALTFSSYKHHNNIVLVLYYNQTSGRDNTTRFYFICV